MFDMKRLEYGKVLHILSDFCVSDYSKEKVQQLSPSSRSEEIEQLFGHVFELQKAFEHDCVFTQPVFPVKKGV